MKIKDLINLFDKSGIVYHLNQNKQQVEVEYTDQFATNTCYITALTQNGGESNLFRVIEYSEAHDGAGDIYKSGENIFKVDELIEYIKNKQIKESPVSVGKPATDVYVDPNKPQIVGKLNASEKEMKSWRRFEENISQLKNNIDQKIQEALKKEKLKEYDAIFAKKESWENSKKSLKANLQSLLKNIDDDNYKESIEEIEKTISLLNGWKNKIEKFLD